jgi:predicted nuclease of predicted toxin-antitoxin system
VKLLLDHNLSPKLIRLLADVYPECTHVRELGMERAQDTEVWRYAAENGFTIVTKDADFHQRSLLLGSPPKVVWLRIGNCSVAESAAALRERYLPIRRFIEESPADYLVLS